jgi:hypothetical protein
MGGHLAWLPRTRAPEKIRSGFIYCNLQCSICGASKRHVIYCKLHLFLHLYQGQWLVKIKLRPFPMIFRLNGGVSCLCRHFLISLLFVCIGGISHHALQEGGIQIDIPIPRVFSNRVDSDGCIIVNIIQITFIVVFIFWLNLATIFLDTSKI